MDRWVDGCGVDGWLWGGVAGYRGGRMGAGRVEG